MDNIAMILFGCVVCTLTGLNFIELRRIRKKLDAQAASKSTAA
jgi:hypothetical protein